jgi:phage host-nuclease inhibitor protein Gam
MSKNRIKKSLAAVITTREEAETRMRDLALAANLKVTLVADMDDQILMIKGRYEEDIAEQDAKIKAATADLEAWALAHPEEFGKRKSIEFLSGVLGFRTGTPKLELSSRKWNWKSVTEAVEEFLPNFIRSKPEVDKDAILGQRDELAEMLPQVGLKVTQGESFFVEPKLTDPVAR